MKYLYQQLDELLNTIKYADEIEAHDYLDDVYFDDILETCKEIVELTKEQIMPNMSYCRFENTAKDMRDCIDAIEEGDTSELSSSEVRALEEFLDLVREITNLEYDIEQILEDYDS